MQIKEFKEKEVDVKDKSLSNKVYFAVGGIVLAVILIVAVFIKVNEFEDGTETARLLLEKIEKQDSDDNGADSDTVKHIKIPCEIKIRESVPKRNE